MVLLKHFLRQPDHNLSIELIKKIPELINNSVLSFESGNDNQTIIFVCDNLRNEATNKDLINVVHLSSIKDSSGKVYEINKLATSHYREIEKALNWAIENDKNIFVNERTKEWVLRNDLCLHQPITTLLLSHCSTYELEKQIKSELIEQFSEHEPCDSVPQRSDAWRIQHGLSPHNPEHNGRSAIEDKLSASIARAKVADRANRGDFGNSNRAEQTR